MSDFRQFISENYPNEANGDGMTRKVPPPLPAKKAPPLPPKKTAPVVDSNGFTLADGQRFDTRTGERIVGDDGQAIGSAADRLRAIAAALPAAVPAEPPKAEAGFVNPPEAALKPLCATPEEAIAVHGTVESAEPATPADDLDGLTKAQLLTLCEELGVGAEATKGKRETGLKKLVRDARQQLGQEVAQMVLADRDEYADQTPTQPLTSAIAETAAAVERVAVAMGSFEDFGVHGIDRTITQEPEMTVEHRHAFTLYVNCRPDSGVDVEQHVLVTEANRMIQEQSGHQAYQLVEYGKGVAYLGLAVKDALERGEFGAVKSIALDTRTHEGQALLTTLSSLAHRTTRGT